MSQDKSVKLNSPLSPVPHATETEADSPLTSSSTKDNIDSLHNVLSLVDERAAIAKDKAAEFEKLCQEIDDENIKKDQATKEAIKSLDKARLIADNLKEEAIKESAGKIYKVEVLEKLKVQEIVSGMSEAIASSESNIKEDFVGLGEGSSINVSKDTDVSQPIVSNENSENKFNKHSQPIVSNENNSNKDLNDNDWTLLDLAKAIAEFIFKPN